MAGLGITPGVPAAPVDPTATPALDPTGRDASERRRQRGGRMPRRTRAEQPDDDEDELPPQPAPGRIDVIA